MQTVEEISQEQNKEELLLYYLQLKEQERDQIMSRFIPDNAKAVPFAEQLRFFKDTTLTRLLRCGNRSGKTFSTMRELAWKITRSHPYRKKWREDYDTSTKKEFWIAGPSYDFIDSTMWAMYLEKFIPSWYYTDPDTGKPMITYTNMHHIDTITFRNGDTIECKSYAQADLTVMGRAIDDLTVDEMPRSLKLLSELITRTLDRDGEVTLGFTPIIEDEEIKNYLENSPKLATHTWSLTANPHYRDNPERLQRAMDEWAGLSLQERNTRLKGDWYYEVKGGRVFEGLVWEEVEDFKVPHEWRRARIVDPAAHVTGFTEWAENPVTNDWYCINAVEFKWKEKLATDQMLLTEIKRYKPFEGFLYTLSIYDNAEAWFGSEGAKEGFTPCMLKNRAMAIIELKKCISSGKFKVFKIGGKLLVNQTINYSFKEDGSVKRVKDHVLDTAMYFARQIPAKSQIPARPMLEKDYIKAEYFAQQEQKSKQQAPASKREVYVRRFIRRGVR